MELLLFVAFIWLFILTINIASRNSELEKRIELLQSRMTRETSRLDSKILENAKMSRERDSAFSKVEPESSPKPVIGAKPEFGSEPETGAKDERKLTTVDEAQPQTLNAMASGPASSTASYPPGIGPPPMPPPKFRMPDKQSGPTDKQARPPQQPAAARQGSDEEIPTPETTPIAPPWDPGTSTWKTIFSPVLEILSVIFGPLGALWEMVYGAYSHYKARGRGAVFFLMVIGMVTITTGFIYVLKYSFDNYLGEMAKVALGFVAAAATLCLGIHITRKKTSHAEYGSSLMGLGLILNYTTIYFLSGYFGLVAVTTGFALIVASTLFSFWLAVRFETRIVSVVTLVGGSCSPIFLDSGKDPLFFFIYLLILTSAAVAVSRKIDWKPLSTLSFLLSSILLETLLLSGSTFVSPLQRQFLAMAFGYLFIFESLIRRPHAGMDTKLFMGALSLLAFNVYLTFDPSTLGGYAYGFNALVLIGLSRVEWLPDPRGARSLLITGASAFTALAVLTGVHPDFAGVLWGVEALILLHAGHRMDDPLLTREGGILLAISFARSAATLPTVLGVFGIELDSPGYWNLILTIFLWMGAIHLLRRNRADQARWELRLLGILREAVPIAVLSAYHLTVFKYAAGWAFTLAWIPMFAAVWYGGSRRLGLTHVLGLSHYLLLMAAIFISISSVDSYHFSDQTLQGKTARIEAFLILWLMPMFYGSLLGSHPLGSRMMATRELFYLMIPVLIPLPFRRHFPQYLSHAVWLGLMSCLFLERFVGFSSLRRELRLYCLFSGAFVAMRYATMSRPWAWSGELGALLAGIPVLCLISLFLASRDPRGGRNSRREYGHVLSMPFHYGAVVLFLIPGVTFNMPHVGAFAAAAIYFAAAAMRHRFTVLSAMDLSLGLFLARMAAVWGLLVSFERITRGTGPWPAVLSLALLTAGIWTVTFGSRPIHFQPSGLSIVPRLRLRFLDAALFHTLCLALESILFEQIFGQAYGALFSVALAVHGLSALFQAMRPGFGYLSYLGGTIILWLMIKLYTVDLANLGPVGKIGVFCAVGSLLLAASYRMLSMRQEDESKIE